MRVAARARRARSVRPVGGRSWPGELAPAELKGGARALTTEACEAYRSAWLAYRADCADYHASTALTLIDSLLARYGDEFTRAKRERAAVDFDDLELRAKHLLADPVTRQRWAERFALIMIDEFQDTNRVQLDILEALERDNLFAVGDEFQSIYRFRHADVTIFRGRAQQLAAVRTLTTNFRSREELLDVINAAFAPEFGSGSRRCAPVGSNRRPTTTGRCGCSRSTRPPARRRSSC